MGIEDGIVLPKMVEMSTKENAMPIALGSREK